MDKFDPYHKWLGIPPEDQPPHHYRLLAINLFESDLDVIDTAANRQMSFLKQCTSGPNAAHSQELLNAVAAARLCLLKPATKSAYDAELRARLVVGARFEPLHRNYRDVDAGVVTVPTEPAVARPERPQAVMQLDASPDNPLSNFLENVAMAPAVATSNKRASPARKKRDAQRMIFGNAAAAALLLAILVISLRTKDGTLTVQLEEPDAEVQVLDAAGKVEITRKGDHGPVTIAVVPGQHRLKVQKDGFELFTTEFEIKSGGKTSILARLSPLDDNAGGAAAAAAVAKAEVAKTVPPPAPPAKDATRPARFEVLAMQPVPLKGNAQWSELPDVLQEASIYERSAGALPDGVAGNELALTVKEPGLLVIAACWENDGNPSGGWYETRTTEEALVQQGWQPGGTLKRTDEHGVNTYHLFYKQSAAGEKVQFHTRKYRPPRVLEFKPGTAVSAELLSPADHKASPPTTNP